MKNVIALVIFLAVTFIAPALGAFSPPGEWYASLNKPWWIFGPVWTALYTMMAVAAWLVWRRGGCTTQRRPLSLYVVQLALNAAWTPIFFGLRMPRLALVEILLLLAAIITTALAFHRAGTGAAMLLVPYAARVGFASFLNFTLWRLNP